MMGQITTFKIGEKLRISEGCFREWWMRGFIYPSIQKANGPGTKNIFSVVDVYRIKLFKNLIEFGFSRQKASEIVSNCDNFSGLMIKSGDNVTLVEDINDLIDAFKNECAVFINLSEIKRQVDSILDS